MSVRKFLGIQGFLLFFILGVLCAQTEVLFSPDDRPAKKLISLIDESKSHVHAAVYLLTDKRVAQALIRAKSRGVDVQIVVDKMSAQGIYGKAPMLVENGIDVFIYALWPKPMKQKTRTFSYKADPLMHNKFAIIDEKTWTGSFNWTRSGDHKNQENVVILDEKEVREKFEQRFELLKTKSECWKGVEQKRSVAPEPVMVKNNSQEIKQEIVEFVAQKVFQEFSEETY